ncbi:hypothetical protein Metok_0378 [Methanothermococcus okinawensis IH1]|uniref:Uncharacterized protein n=2 Tax=Methanothermococcus okinawensis TaxID=155863 RepID=F8AKN4_METOI|nr:hypothetical protein Metok_0378 [Methanothermococcus okinawensis IH1]
MLSEDKRRISAVIKNVYSDFERELAIKALEYIKSDLWDYNNCSDIKVEGNTVRIEFEAPYFKLDDERYWAKRINKQLINDMKFELVNLEKYGGCFKNYLILTCRSSEVML